MVTVMKKAQELAEAILASDVYQRMKAAEGQIGVNPDATLAVAAYMEKRDAVDKLLHSADMDPAQLAVLAGELEQAEQVMNQQPVVLEMQEARKAFDEMMDSINRVLRLVINGDPTEQETAGCTGSCATCHSACASRK